MSVIFDDEYLMITECTPDNPKDWNTRYWFQKSNICIMAMADKDVVNVPCPICHEQQILKIFTEEGVFDCQNNLIAADTVQICRSCHNDFRTLQYGETSLEALLKGGKP